MPLDRAWEHLEVKVPLPVLGSEHDASALAVGGSPVQPSLQAAARWGPSPTSHQSVHRAAYRLGHDATSGISGILTVDGPNTQHAGWSWTLELGISIDRKLELEEVTRLIAAGLTDLVSGLPAALPDLFADLGDLQVEVQLSSPNTDGNELNRPNSLDRRVELQPLGPPSSEIGHLMTVSTRISQPATAADLTDLAVDGLEYMALSHGWLDPTAEIERLRGSLEDRPNQVR